MIKLDDITEIKNVRLNLLINDLNSPVVDFLILKKGENRKGMFIGVDDCVAINGYRFDPAHYIYFNENKLWLKRDINISDEDEDYDEEYDYGDIYIKRYYIDGYGDYWLIYDEMFWIWGDLPPEEIN